MEAREESQISVTVEVTFKVGIEGPIRVYQAGREEKISSRDSRTYSFYKLLMRFNTVPD